MAAAVTDSTEATFQPRFSKNCSPSGGAKSNGAFCSRLRFPDAGLESQVFDAYGDDTVVYPGHGDDTTLGDERPRLAEWRERGW